MHVIEMAKHIADILDGDPVMARQVKEHISPARLLEILEIEAPEPEVEQVEAEIENDDLIREIETRWRSFSKAEKQELRLICLPKK